jgi:hypothetical protein
VQLCLAPNSGAVPQAAASAGSSPSAAPAATDVQPLPARDSGVRPGAGPDISGLLDLLASRADEVSAQAAGLQTITASDRQ